MDANQEFGWTERLADGLAVGLALSLAGASMWMVAVGEVATNMFLLIGLALAIGAVVGAPIGYWKGRRYVGGHWLSPALRKGLVGFSATVLVVFLVAVPLIPARQVTPDQILARTSALREKLGERLKAAIESGDEAAQQNVQDAIEIVDQAEETAEKAAEKKGEVTTKEGEEAVDLVVDALDDTVEDIDEWLEERGADEPPPSPTQPVFPETESTEVAEVEKEVGSYFPIPPEIGMIFPPAFFIAWGIGGKQRHRIVTRTETFTKEGDPPSEEELKEMLAEAGLEGEAAVAFLEGWERAAHEADLSDEERAAFLAMVDSLLDGAKAQAEAEDEQVSEGVDLATGLYDRYGPSFDAAELKAIEEAVRDDFGDLPERFGASIVKRLRKDQGIEDAAFLKAVVRAFQL